MKKNKRTRRIFSRVLDHLRWSNVYRIHAGENAYKAALAAKRLLEECGCENVKVAFYDREYHLHFEIYHAGYDCNRYYTVSASHGYVNDYHNTNKSHVNHLIASAEFVRDCTLRRDYTAYQSFQRYGNAVLVWGLDPQQYDTYSRNGNIANIPYDVAIQLWRDLGECLGRIVNEAVAYRRDVL